MMIWTMWHFLSTSEKMVWLLLSDQFTLDSLHTNWVTQVLTLILLPILKTSILELAKMKPFLWSLSRIKVSSFCHSFLSSLASLYLTVGTPFIADRQSQSQSQSGFVNPWVPSRNNFEDNQRHFTSLSRGHSASSRGMDDSSPAMAPSSIWGDFGSPHGIYIFKPLIFSLSMPDCSSCM